MLFTSCFILLKGAIDVVFILRRLQEEYNAKGETCICVL